MPQKPAPAGLQHGTWRSGPGGSGFLWSLTGAVALVQRALGALEFLLAVALYRGLFCRRRCRRRTGPNNPPGCKPQARAVSEVGNVGWHPGGRRDRRELGLAVRLHRFGYGHVEAAHVAVRRHYAGFGLAYSAVSSPHLWESLMQLRDDLSGYRRGHRFPIWLMIVIGLLAGLVGTGLYNRRDELLGNTPLVTATPVPTPDTITMLGRARDMERAGQLLLALAAYEEIASLTPDDPFPLVAQSKIYIRFEETDKALETAQRAFDLDNGNQPALNALGRALDWTGQYEDAVDFLVEALTQNPHDPDTLAILGEVYADVGNWGQAELYLNQALEADPDSTLAWRNRALLYERQGLYPKALEALNQGLVLDPGAWDLEIYKGRMYEALFEWDEALAAYQRSVDINSYISDTYDALGYGHFKVGNDLEALRVLKLAVEINPLDGEAQAHLGSAYYRLRSYERAVDILALAVELLGDRARIEFLYQLGLAHIYKEPRECELAIPWLVAALEIDPLSAPALEGLSECPPTGT